MEPQEQLDRIAKRFSVGVSPLGDRTYSFRITNGLRSHEGTYTGPLPPSPGDLLRCLLLDAASVEDCADWVDWADDWGLFSEPIDREKIRKAQQDYESCQEARYFLVCALTLPGYHEAAELAREC